MQIPLKLLLPFEETSKKEKKLVQIAQERELKKVLKVGLLFWGTQKNNCDTRKKALTYFSE